MKPERYNRELRYWLTRALTKELVGRGLLSASDFDHIDKKLAALYAPMIAKLRP